MFEEREKERKKERKKKKVRQKEMNKHLKRLNIKENKVALSQRKSNQVFNIHVYWYMQPLFK